MLNWILLLAAAFGAGMLNAVAGGGTFLTFPALVAVGLPPIAANATSTVAVLPGYLASAIGYREEIRRTPVRRLGVLALVALAGGLAGSLLLLITPGRLFDAVVPWLLLFATVLFLAGDRITAAARAAGRGTHALLLPGLFACSVYGGYFNGGLGIILMALFAISGMRDLNEANGLKNGIAFALSVVSVATFLAAGIVDVPSAAGMMAANAAGGYAGARIARRLPRGVIKAVIVTVGVVMSALFFLR